MKVDIKRKPRIVVTLSRDDASLVRDILKRSDEYNKDTHPRIDQLAWDLDDAIESTEP